MYIQCVIVQQRYQGSYLWFFLILVFFCYQVTQTKAAIEEREGKIDNKTQIEIIKEEVRKIDEEHQEQKEEERKEIERVSMIPYWLSSFVASMIRLT